MAYLPCLEVQQHAPGLLSDRTGHSNDEARKARAEFDPKPPFSPRKPSFRNGWTSSLIPKLAHVIVQETTVKSFRRDRTRIPAHARRLPTALLTEASHCLRSSMRRSSSVLPWTSSKSGFAEVAQTPYWNLDGRSSETRHVSRPANRGAEATPCKSKPSEFLPL
jgi:hypothetical protein